MRKIDDTTFVDQVMGYTVMALVQPTSPGTFAVGLAFCSPIDRLAGAWSREDGKKICQGRIEEGLHKSLVFREHLDVRDYVLEAIKWDHPYVPDAISRRVLREARRTLDRKAKTRRPQEPAQAVWRFEVDCGRMGMLEGIFTATQQELEAIYGYTQFVHDVLGKHSEIQVAYEAGHFTKVSDNATAVRVFDATVGEQGINPLTYDQGQLADWLEGRQEAA